MEPLVYSFFSGAGGLDLGLNQAGLSVKIAHDNDPDCCLTLSTNGYSIVMEGDAEQHASPLYLDLLDNARLGEELFAIVGGPPCQSFSVAGKRKGFGDARGNLIAFYLEIIAQLRPRFFVLENVPNLMTVAYDRTSTCAEERERGSALRQITRWIERDLRYDFRYGVFNASDFGAAQNRERFVLIGTRDHEDIVLPTPQRLERRTLRDAIYDLEDFDGPDTCARFSEKQLNFLRHVPEGGNWRSLPKDMQREAMGGALHANGKTDGGCTGFYRRLSYDKPAPTLVTTPTQRATMLCHPTKNRPLSVLEYARIQGFPDTYLFAGSLASRYRQIGNAVPVPLGQAIGLALLETAGQERWYRVS